MSSSRPRVFLVANGTFDSVGDSYRRTLQPHYDVDLFDMMEVVPSWFPYKRLRPTRLSTAAAYFSRAVFRDPLAHAFPPLLRAVRAFAPDVVLITAIQSLPPRVIAQIREASPNTKVIGVFSDHIGNFDRGYFFSADYDALFFKDRYIVEKLRAKLGWRHVHYLPQACDPALHHPVALTAAEREEYACDITLAGTTHYYRAAFLSPLIGRSMKIWGADAQPWFDHPIRAHLMPKLVMGEDKCKAMLAAKVVLNCNHYAEIAGTNKRTFEVAAIGAFQLTDTPALSDVFDPATEVATFDTRDEMLEKLDYYLARPEERLEMARRARERAVREHTYAHRWAAHMGVVDGPLPADFPVRFDDLACRPR